MAFPRDRSQTRKGGRYDRAHQLARAAAAKQHQPSDPCVRCGHPLGPMNSGLHYDHNQNGTAYLGFSHAACNLRAGAQEGRRRQLRNNPRPRPWNSRNW